MPRLAPSLIRRANELDPLLSLLLPVCREISTARNELRWLREDTLNKLNAARKLGSPIPWRKKLRQRCLERARGKPLQFILGTQPFGQLDILCRPGVLIPRPETEAYSAHLASLILKNQSGPRPDHNRHSFSIPTERLRVLDLCTGTGCISLLLHALLHPTLPSLEVLAIDIAPSAIALAGTNLSHNVARGALSPEAEEQVHFLEDDIFTAKCEARLHDQIPWDVVISNPPYISPESFNSDTERSVRNWEPRLALVPPNTHHLEGFNLGDIFYPRIVTLAQMVGARILLLEVADLAQAKRVAAMVCNNGSWEHCEIWRDWPDQISLLQESFILDEKRINIVGQGNGRAVVCWSTGGKKLIGP